MLYLKMARINRTNILLLLSFFVFAAINARGQEITIDADRQPLNKVLIEIRKTSGVQLSFDDNLLSTYTITDHNTYKNAIEAIESILSEFPLKMEQKGIVVLITPESKPVVQYIYTGIIKDRRTGEPLPYSHVVANGNKTITDINGNFTFNTTEQSISLKASYLGYYITDTIITKPGSCVIGLEPSFIGLKMVTITDRLLEKASQIGQQAGIMRLNKMIGFHLPGNADNSIYNLMRLQPGILAAGESSNDLIIRGSYEGQSKVIFDGFTVFGVKNYNDNIGAVNPLISKDIEVLKSSYDAKYGGRVGGIVNITGINGNTKDFSLQTNINNFTINSLVEIPLFRQSALSLAFRHTYYNLYNPETYTISRNYGNSEIPVDIKIIPNYAFRDINAKYSTQTKTGNLFYFSLFGAGDKFGYKINEDLGTNKAFERSADEDNQQLGFSLYYGKNWKKGNRSSILFSFGSLATTWNDSYDIYNQITLDTISKQDYTTHNSINEATVKFENQIQAGQNHTLEFAAGVVANGSALNTDSTGTRITTIESSSLRLTSYIQDKISIGSHLLFTPGLRINYASSTNRFYAEPRLTGSFIANDEIRLNFGIGRYYQYISKTQMLDDSGRIRYFWITCDGNSIPVISSDHYTIGPNYAITGFQASVEFFYKKTDDISRYIRNTSNADEGIYLGDSHTLGLDIYVRKDFGQHSAWVSYTLSRTMEKFEYFARPLYRRAVNDQLHEVKSALLLNFKPWYFSANYVYGSGVALPLYLEAAGLTEQFYSRMDIAGTYSFQFKKINMEAGVSILNLLNTKNIKYSNFERIVYGQNESITLFTEAIPFTPTLNFKIQL